MLNVSPDTSDLHDVEVSCSYTMYLLVAEGFHAVEVSKLSRQFNIINIDSCLTLKGGQFPDRFIRMCEKIKTMAVG